MAIEIEGEKLATEYYVTLILIGSVEPGRVFGFPRESLSSLKGCFYARKRVDI